MPRRPGAKGHDTPGAAGEHWNEVVKLVASGVWSAEAAASPAVYVKPLDTLAEAIATMDRHGYSRVPVFDGRQVTGAITGRTLRRLLASPVDPRSVRVAEVMDPPLRAVSPGASLAEVLNALQDQPAVLVVTPGHPPGIITYVDVVRTAEPYLHLLEFERMLRDLLAHLLDHAPPGGWLSLLAPGQARRVREACQRDGGRDELEYLDLYDLGHVLRSGWRRWFAPWFAPLTAERTRHLLDTVRRLRNDVAHMRPLSPAEREALLAAIGEITGALRPRLRAASERARGRR